MKIPVQIYFNDLDFSKKQELIDMVSKEIYNNYKDEAENGNKFVGNVKNFGRKEYEGMTWQEAVCREYSIDYIMFEDLEGEELKNFDWDTHLKNHCEEEAESKLYDTFKYLEVEVEI